MGGVVSWYVPFTNEQLRPGITPLQYAIDVDSASAVDREMIWSVMSSLVGDSVD